jgi:hypothetical protein
MPPKREAEDMARRQGKHKLPTGITLDRFPGTEVQRGEAHRLFSKYTDVFAADKDDMGRTSTTYHRIHTKDDVPVMQRHRRIPPNVYKEVKQHLQDLLKRDVIRPSKSDYASLIVGVRKKSGALRLCVDHQLFNSKSRRGAYLLPWIQESLDALRGVQFFSTIDLASAYNQVEVDPRDRHKTAFTTPMGLFEYNRMSFGLQNTPATFQRLMQGVFREELLQTMMVYLDDIILFAGTVDEHLQRLETVLKKLREQVPYLGHIMSADGVATDPGKTRAVS